MTDDNCEEEISKLRRSNEDLRDFAHMAAHELQEPLRAMESFIGLLNEKYGAEMTPEAREWLAETTDGASRMRQLIQSLLTFSSVDSDGIEFEPISCADVLKTALIDLKPVIDAGQVQVLVESELPSIQGNAVLMSLLFRNLIGNSIKYCLEKPLIKIRAVAKNGEVIFEFVDNGIGFDMQYVDKIFKPFERLHPKANYPGTGLGLALCKRIIERHHGKIWVTSEVDKGSTFSFSLPKLQADA